MFSVSSDYKMGWFSKKEEKKEIPELPELPRLSELTPMISNSKYNYEQAKLPELPKEMPVISKSSLPSLPSSSFSEKFNREVIKAGVRDEEGEYSKEMPTEEEEEPEEYGEKEMEEPEYSSKSYTRREQGPIFVRLDKYESAIQGFAEIKKKVAGVNELLKKAKELNERENYELAEWERNLESIKAKIDSIDKSIFSKLD
jgi:hypothetical protein